MNYRNVCFQLGLLFLVLSAFMLAIGTGAFVRYGSGWAAAWMPAWAFVISGGMTALAAAGLMLAGRGRTPHIGRREALLLVACSWIVGGIFAAGPFYLWAQLTGSTEPAHPFESFINCYFESVSGLTTVGASILADIESVPPSLLFWRAFTQWMGGIGIVVVFVAVFPSLGASARKLYQFEASGITHEAVMPRIRDAARVLLLIYIGLTLAAIVLLMLCGMPGFDAVAHAFTSISTAGYSPRNASIGAYDSAAIDVVTIAFMVLGGVNFALYHDLLRKRFRSVWRNRELRLYLTLIAGVSLVAALMLLGGPIFLMTGEVIEPSFWTALRFSAFNVASVQTTTGYATANFDAWPALAQALLFGLMLIGGSAGSTAGGLKVIRVLVAFKVVTSFVERAFRPAVIRPVKIGPRGIDADLQMQTLAYLLAAIVLMTLGSAAVVAFEPDAMIDVTTAVSANVATFCTVGPGFGLVGPADNFGWMTTGSKLVLCLMMILGRLEMFAVLVLVTPRFWRSA